MYKISKYPLLENIFFLCCLFPFVSPYPCNTDTQPLAGFFALLVILKSNKVSGTQAALLMFSFLGLFYVNIYDFNIHSFSHASMYMLLYAMIVLVACMKSARFYNPSLFNVVIIIYSAVSLLTILLPSLMVSLQGHIVREVRVQDIDSVRGLSVFATEPGLLGGLSVCFLFINDFFFCEDAITIRRYLFNISMILFILLCTKSGSSIMFLLFYFLYKLKISFKSVISFVIFVFTILCIYKLLPDTFSANNRAVNLLKLFFSGHIALDTSIGSRVYSFYIGLKSILFYPFGVGIDPASKESAINTIIHYYPDALHFFHNYGIGVTTAINSSFGNLAVSYGVFGWAFIAYIYMVVFKNVSLRLRLFTGLFLVSSYSAAFPTAWLVLVLGSFSHLTVGGSIFKDNRGSNICVE